jgi:hypothetical protein
MISAGFFGVYCRAGAGLREGDAGTSSSRRAAVDGRFARGIPTRLARGEPADVVIMDGHGPTSS